ncbi:hypothetical protein [Reichenbachiella ulvae]|uniref:Uncharacterized protein n=1 Tax=Reichenbachiella ulvae TaxID=2980104 RepID=A0ABT3CQU5_9BACT|nr:hypothetical protein [Reichenbachiella ulvae]MCV9385854.1 hypothetical protein [Reichenbachiella ulvae]
MTGSVALDVVIGLVFIYLLYSLFATLIAEIVATNLSLRARNLKEAINRMINDEDDKEGWLTNIKVHCNIMPKKVSNFLIRNFYDHQEVKYLGRKATLNPSAIQSSNFSKVLLDRIKALGEGDTELEKIQSGLSKLSVSKPDLDGYVQDVNRILGPSTAAYVKGIFEDCQNRIDDGKEQVIQFKHELENWFDRTMDQTTEWYKQRMQKILLIIGFMMAWIFNADTFTIIKKLSYDKDARDKVVELAGAYIENNRYADFALISKDSTLLNDTSRFDSASIATLKDYNTNAMTYNQRLDTLFAIKNSLEADMTSAHSVLGLGGWLPDSLQISNSKIVCPDWVEVSLANRVLKVEQEEGHVTVEWIDKLHYMLWLLLSHPGGYLITALAVSLGAPFWFDLLSKLMKLRGTMQTK